jgi:hypothetical protein
MENEDENRLITFFEKYFEKIKKLKNFEKLPPKEEEILSELYS